MSLQKPEGRDVLALIKSQMDNVSLSQPEALAYGRRTSRQQDRVKDLPDTSLACALWEPVAHNSLPDEMRATRCRAGLGLDKAMLGFEERTGGWGGGRCLQHAVQHMLLLLPWR